MSNEKKFLTYLSDSLDSKMNYNDISNYVNVEKYKKDKKINKIGTKISLAFSAVLALSLSIFLLINKLSTKDIDTAGTPYDGIVNQDFKNGNYDGPYYGNSGPLPAPAIIDGFFTDEITIKRNEYVYQEYLSTFSYLYEVEYSNASSYFVAAYIKKSKAKKIYENCKEVCDATPASPLDSVDGTIVMWFHGQEFYDEDDILWYRYDSEKFVSPEINGYLCLGVYRTQTRTITKEIFSNENVNIVDEVYQTVYFSNEGNQFLKPVEYELKDTIKWYGFDRKVNDENKKYLFSQVFMYVIETIIDKENNVISLNSMINRYYLGEISTDCEDLIKFYELANELRVEGVKNYHNSHFKYNEFVLLLQSLYKNTK